jgi:4-alpha-glucanotransferase
VQGSLNALQPKTAAALKILGIRNFLLGIHDAAFPGLPEEDIGRGSPYSGGAAGFVSFVRSLGFNGIQLGPQGITTLANPSPYDGTLFSKNPLSLALLSLTKSPWNLLSVEMLAELTSRRPYPGGRIHGSHSRAALQRILTEISRRFRSSGAPYTSLRLSFAAFRRENAAWLDRDALYEVLKDSYGGRNWKDWGNARQPSLDRHLLAPPKVHESAARCRLNELFRLHGKAIEEYSFIQYLLAEQHNEFRERCRQLGLKLFGDCQIGLSGRDAWYTQSFVLRDYVMGAPPSRTNPEGQPWNYPVLDPRQYYLTAAETGGPKQPGPAVRFLQERIDKLFEQFDGLRIDHPHGLVCPWVYRADQKDPVSAVQKGARLFASPALADFPALAEFAIVRPDQINEQAARYDDNWVIILEPEQVSRYAALFEVIVESARKNCTSGCELACEILSTQPYPIKRVMERYGLGRFRVTQKADLDNACDVYRGENAQPEDWLMLGNHDTPSIWQVAENWVKTGVSRQQADYLATRLFIPEHERTPWAENIAADSGALAQAKFADLFLGPARNIMVFFTDLLGLRQAYNQPGSVSVDNWSLRVEPDYKKVYYESLAAGRALNIPKALAAALRARGRTLGDEHRELVRELENQSWPSP